MLFYTVASKSCTVTGLTYVSFVPDRLVCTAFQLKMYFLLELFYFSRKLTDRVFCSFNAGKNNEMVIGKTRYKRAFEGIIYHVCYFDKQLVAGMEAVFFII